MVAMVTGTFVGSRS